MAKNARSWQESEPWRRQFEGLLERLVATKSEEAQVGFAMEIFALGRAAERADAAARERVAMAARWRALNDFHRKSGEAFVLPVADCSDIGPEGFEELVGCVREFDGFTAQDDPSGEHKRGVCEVDGVRYFWKFEHFVDGDIPQEVRRPEDHMPWLHIGRLEDENRTARGTAP